MSRSSIWSLSGAAFILFIDDMNLNPITAAYLFLAFVIITVAWMAVDSVSTAARPVAHLMVH